MLAIIELIIAILLVLSWFVTIPFGQFALAVVLLIVLIIQLVPRRTYYGDHDRRAHPDRRLHRARASAGSSSRASTADPRCSAPSGADAIELGDLMPGECDIRRRHEVEQLLRPAR